MCGGGEGKPDAANKCHTKKKARTKKTITTGFLLVRPKELKMSSFLEIDTEAIATVRSGGGEGGRGGGVGGQGNSGMLLLNHLLIPDE